MNKQMPVLGVIGVGNMANAIITGILNSQMNVSEFILYDKFTEKYQEFKEKKFKLASSVVELVEGADVILISVKPQNYDEVLDEIVKADGFNNKLYISIGAGISSDSVSKALNDADVVRALPNLPMTIGKGVTVICKNNAISSTDFDFVCDAFKSSGSVIVIDESEMNRIIGVTSSSPAYVFKFIDAMYEGAVSQGLESTELLMAICDTVIGAATLLKQSAQTPKALISKVASKGGTTEEALKILDEYEFEEAIYQAMLSCTQRADELGLNNK